MVNEVPELYIKASVFTVDVLHAKCLSCSNTRPIDEILLANLSLRYIDASK